MTSTGSIGIRTDVTFEPAALRYNVRGNIRATFTISAPTKLDAKASKTAVHYVFVLDRSMSMSEGNEEKTKWNYARSSIHYILDRCLLQNKRTQDFVTLISFSNDVETHFCAQQSTTSNIKNIGKFLDTLQLQNRTNLSDAIIEKVPSALRQCDKVNKRRLDIAITHAVFVLTDGDANAGIVHPKSILEAVKKTYGKLPDSITKSLWISTFGYGINHNHKLMYDIATFGGGVYYCIETYDGIATAIGDAFAQIDTMCTDNVTFELQARDGCRVTTIISPDQKITETVKGKRFTITIPMLRYDEKRHILCELSLNSQTTPNTKPILNYVTQCRLSQHSGSIKINRYADLMNEQQWLRVYAYDILSDTLKYVFKRLYQNAATTLADCKARIATMHAAKTDVIKNIMKDLEMCHKYCEQTEKNKSLHGRLVVYMLQMMCMYGGERHVVPTWLNPQESMSGIPGFTVDDELKRRYGNNYANVCDATNQHISNANQYTSESIDRYKTGGNAYFNY